MEISISNRIYLDTAKYSRIVLFRGPSDLIWYLQFRVAEVIWLRIHRDIKWCGRMGGMRSTFLNLLLQFYCLFYYYKFQCCQRSDLLLWFGSAVKSYRPYSFHCSVCIEYRTTFDKIFLAIFNVKKGIPLEVTSSF